MGRSATIIGLVGARIGLGAGYLWWGLPLGDMRAELADTRARLEGLERRQQAGPTARPDDSRGRRERIEARERDLERERAMRSRLESVTRTELEKLLAP